MRTDPPLITIDHFLRILWARRVTIVIALGVALFLGTTWTLRTPKTYAAHATVLLDVKSPDPLNGLQLQGLMAPSYMNTQVDLIGSETVARRVIQELKLTDDDELKQQWQGATGGRIDQQTWLVEWLGKNLEVNPTRDSNVLQVGFRARDPKLAAEGANAFVKAYIGTTLDLRVAPARQYKQFFDTSAQKLREDLETAQRRLSAYQQSNGLIGSDETFDVETARLNALVSQLVLMQSQASESGSRQAATRSDADQSQEALNSPLITSLRTDLQRANSRLQELNETLGRRHPQIVQLKANIAELKARIDEETRRVVGGVRVGNTINKQRLAELQAEVQAQRVKVMRMKATRDEAMVLQRDVDSAQKAYDGVLSRASQMGLESEAGQTNVLLVGAATPPARPISPNAARNIAASLLFGLIGGLVAALVREARDQRIRTEEQAMALLQQPLVSIVPNFRPERVPQRREVTPMDTRASRLITS